jgi:hypothetical protein
MQGVNLRNIIELLQEFVINNGKPVVVDGQGTIEVLNKGFTITYNHKIDLFDIRNSMIMYYRQNNINFDKIQELESNEYKTIENELYEKFKIFSEDINSRRVLWSDDCCISMIHYLIRDNRIYCYVNLRSSDVVNKLFSDIFLIHKITAYLQDKLSIDNILININAHSLHKLVLNNMDNCK